MVEPTAPLTHLIEALESRAVSARELLDMYVDRVARLDGDINSVVTLDVDRARATASTIDDARANDHPVGVLAGVPTTIKDAIATSGIRSTGGAVELTDHVPDIDATVVQTIKRAGAVVFGKTNLPRWSADFQSYNELFGTTRNPWDPTRTPGGSSGGAAAAVAAGLTGFEIGTDIGGSIRVPASFCGIYGHKPSFGTVPTHGYLDNPVFHRDLADVNVFGPFGRSVDDLELLLDLLVMPNPDDTPAWSVSLPPARATALSGFRVAAWTDDPFCPVDASVRMVLDATVAALADAGARIDHAVRPDIDHITATLEGLTLIAAAAGISSSDDAHEEDRLAGRAFAHRDQLVLHRRRGQVRQRWHEFFEQVDVLLCPVAPVPAFGHIASDDESNFAAATLDDFGGRPYSDLLWWCGMIGSAYLPATVVPLGRTPAGLPVGIQIVAPFLHDNTALAFARCMRDIIGGYEPPPIAIESPR